MGKTTTITAKEFYSGFDPETNQDFTLETGDSIDVSDAKIEQLTDAGLIDRFEVGAKAARKSTTGSEDLSKLKVPQLQAKADDLGVSTVDADGRDLKKAELVEAIAARQAEVDDELDGLDRDSLINLATSIGLADPADLDDDELRAGIRRAKDGGN